jgi:hypothetical protein
MTIIMKQTTTLLLLSFLIALAAQSVAAQGGDPSAKPQAQTAQAPKPNTDTAITPTHVVGEVATINPATKQMTVNTEAGSKVAVIVNDKTAYLRIPPGEKTLEKAAKITLADVEVGDKVYARGKVAEDKSSISTLQVIVMSKADIATKQAREREEWQRRSLAGIVTALNPEKKELTMRARTVDGVRIVIVSAGEEVKFRRYAPNSIKFSDAKPSSFAEVKVNDQIRALGDKSPDGSTFMAQEIISGAFRTVAGTITAINPQTHEIQIAQVGDKKSITIIINHESKLRRLPPELADALAKMITPAGTSSPANPPPPADPEMTKGKRTIQEELEHQPQLSLADIKLGEGIIISSTAGGDNARLTAITLVAGADPLLKAVQPRGTPVPGSNPLTGLPAGVLDFAVGVP